MDDDRHRTPPRSGDLKPTDRPDADDMETEGSTGSLVAPQMPPVLDDKSSPNINKRG